MAVAVGFGFSFDFGFPPLPSGLLRLLFSRVLLPFYCHSQADAIENIGYITMRKLHIHISKNNLPYYKGKVDTFLISI